MQRRGFILRVQGRENEEIVSHRKENLLRISTITRVGRRGEQGALRRRLEKGGVKLIFIGEGAEQGKWKK